MSLVLEKARYVYDGGTAFACAALDDVSLEVADGGFTVVCGDSGAGKSTLLQLCNGLKRPTFGRVLLDGVDIHADATALKRARREVGLVFQYPEQQLFAEDVFGDVSFGPKNLGLPEHIVAERAEAALTAVGIASALFRRSPFQLSGGERRRVAIAGVLALAPKVLLLDEPTAGLDPIGRRELLATVATIRRQRGLTVVAACHHLDIIAPYATRFIALKNGSIVADGDPEMVFGGDGDAELQLPVTVSLLRQLRRRGIAVDPAAVTVDAAAAEILQAAGRKRYDP